MSIYQMVSKIGYNNNNRETWEKISAKDLVDLPKTSKADLERIFHCFENNDYLIEGTVLQSMLIDELFSRNDPKLIAETFSLMNYSFSATIKDSQSTFCLVAQKIYELNCNEAIFIIFNQHNKNDRDAFLSFMDRYHSNEKSKILTQFEKTKTEIKDRNKKTKNRRQRNNDLKDLAKFIKKYPKELEKLMNGEKVENLLN
jgi:hypothetical protein